MSSHFSLRSLAFYGCAIGLVTALFYCVSAYGEANLKPPSQINGRYQLSAQNPPACLQPNLVLLIQQSGVFLTGSLLPANTDKSALTSAIERPSLSGRWNDQQLTLQGTVDGCPNPFTLQGTLQKVLQKGKLEQVTLNGTLRFVATPQSSNFIAERQPTEEKSEEQGH